MLTQITVKGRLLTQLLMSFSLIFHIAVLRRIKEKRLGEN
jgi:hypothetical protein